MAAINISRNFIVKSACKHFSKAISLSGGILHQQLSTDGIRTEKTASNCLLLHTTLRTLHLSGLCLNEKNSGIDTGSKEHIKSLLKQNKVVVFMKGVPDQPMCGFSNAVVQILRMHGVEYDSHNVLDDDSLRAGIKVYSDWPTIPQVYFDGDFIGGCDILLQMHQSGDLVNELKNIGIRSALLDKQ